MNADIESNVTEAPVYERHPEIFHYTDGRGLYGILNEGQLWATHYNALNDTTEIQLAKDFFVKAFERTSLKFGDLGGARIAPNGPSEAVDLVYRIAFGREIKIGEPFLLSFCGSPKDKYQYENGLLNMWQAYGIGGGYALKFDARKLHDLATEYFPKFGAYALFGVVTYGPGTDLWEGTEKMIQNISDRLFTSLVNSQISGVDRIADLGPGVWKDFVKVCALVKHPAFEIEKEVRFCILRLSILEKGQQTMPIYFRPSDAGPIPYIKLFENKKLLEALKAIIVGPHPQANKRAEFLEFFCRTHCLSVEVIKSRIPFLPMK